MATYGDAKTNGPIASVIPLVVTSYSITTTTNFCHNSFFKTGIRHYPNKHEKRDTEVRKDKKQLLIPQIPRVEGSQNTTLEYEVIKSPTGSRGVALF